MTPEEQARALAEVREWWAELETTGTLELYHPDPSQTHALGTLIDLAEQALSRDEEVREWIGHLEMTLMAIRDGDVPRPLGERWRSDDKPSKNDRCTHGVWMYEDCGDCIAEFADSALGKGPPPEGARGVPRDGERE